VDALFASKKADIYLTGSNSKMLSSELATYLSGRYVAFTIQPLSFGEFLVFENELESGTGTQDKKTSLNRYLEIGGFPALHQITGINTPIAYKALQDIYASIILRDVVERNNIRHIDLLERLLRFLFDNQGHLFSAKSISAFLKNERRKLSEETIYIYIAALEAALIIRKAPRYDIRGKALLAVQEKYYAGDNGLINALLGFNEQRLPGIMENTVFQELKRRGYDVYVGKFGDKEIDFVGLRQNEKIYVQVCYRLGIDPKLIEREFSPLLAIKDNYPKYVVSLDERWTNNREGVRWLNLADFLQF
jgi:predicted AAA+ superfamily ATPase